MPTLAAPDTPITPQAALYHVYLPLAAAARAGTTPLPTQTPPQVDDSGALFMQPEKKVAGPSLKVDARGGMHMVYYDAVPLADKPAATYAYCPPPAAQCGDSSKWSYLAMGDQIDEAQLQLTPAGHPQLLLGYHVGWALVMLQRCQAAAGIQSRITAFIHR